MKYTLAFGWFALIALAGAALAEDLVVRVLLANLGLAFVGVALGYAGLGARLFAKRADGRLRPISYAVYWPYFLLNHALLLAYRRFTRENPFDEIAPGIVLGARLTSRQADALLVEPLDGVLDLTCEFGEIAVLRRSEGYRCIPLLDTTAPTPEQLDDGVAWLSERLEEGRVYVHCAMGHGRSATFVAALLVRIGLEDSAAAAERRIQEHRPRAGLNTAQRGALEEFVARRSDAEPASPD